MPPRQTSSMETAEAMEQHAAMETALVGRAQELAIVERRLAALGAGQGALVLLTGEPGIGKSSLALACTDCGRAMGAACAIGRCYDGGGQPPFAPWNDLLTALSTACEIDAGTLPPPFGTGAAAQSA